MKNGDKIDGGCFGCDAVTELVIQEVECHPGRQNPRHRTTLSTRTVIHHEDSCPDLRRNGV